MGRTLPGAGCPSSRILIRDEHGLLSGGRHSRLPGKFREEIPDSVVSTCVQALCTTGRMST